MSTVRLQQILRARWRFVAAGAAVGLAVAVVVTILTPVKYSATAQIFVSASSPDNTQALAQGNSFVQARVQSYVDVIQSPEVLDPVEATLRAQGDTQLDSLASSVTATAPPNKVIILVTAELSDPGLTAQVANLVAESFTKVVQQLETQQNASISSVKLSVTIPAARPSTPVQPRPALYVALGLIAGLALGVAAAFVRHTTDTTMKRGADLSALGVPVLAEIPFDRRTAQMPISFRDKASSGRSEGLRHLRTNLEFANVDHPPKVIALTSATPAESKTHTAIGLGAALAEAGKTVCVVEADLRRPTIARTLGLIPGVGLTSVLAGTAQLEEVVQNAGKNIVVITSGPIPPNPSELLASNQMAELIEMLQTYVDYIVIDTTPILAVSDAAIVCSRADATIVVVRAGKTRRVQVTRVLNALSQVDAKVVGAVVSMTRSNRTSRYDYGYYAYDAEKAPATSRK